MTKFELNFAKYSCSIIILFNEVMLLLRNDLLEQTCPCSYLNLGGGEEVIGVAPVIFQAFVIFISV